MSSDSSPSPRKAVQPPSHRPSLLLATVLLCLLIAAGAWRMLRRVEPTAVAQAGTMPDKPMQRAGHWYWMEFPRKGKARLVRAAGGTAQPLAEAEALMEYDADGNAVAWIARDGARWSVQVAGADGSRPRALWSGTAQPRGVRLIEKRVWWMLPRAAALPDSGPFPPLGARVEVFSTAVDGGAPTALAVLPEQDGGQVLGAHAGALYVTAYRRSLPGGTAFYRIPLDGGPPRRIAGEEGVQSALLAGDGSLYWLARSRDSSEMTGICCVRRLGRDGKPETLSDWLPAGGMLAETARGLCYTDGGYQPAIWPVGPHTELPHPLALPEGYAAVAAGRDEALLRSDVLGGGSLPLSRIPLP